MNLPSKLALILTGSLMLSGTPLLHAHDLTDWLLGRNNLGSNDCTWKGCQCCDDYCPKDSPCTPNVPTCTPGCYCKKPAPGVPELCPSICPNYCPKPWPCLWKPICGPFHGCGNVPATSPAVLPVTPKPAPTPAPRDMLNDMPAVAGSP